MQVKQLIELLSKVNQFSEIEIDAVNYEAHERIIVPVRKIRITNDGRVIIEGDNRVNV